MCRRSVTILPILALCASAVAQPCDSVNTVYDRTYQNHGVMFNVVAYGPITLDHITANISWNTAEFRLSYKSGGFQGYEYTASAWTSLGTASVVSNNTQTTDTVPTVIPIPIYLPMVAGDTIALYLDAAPLSKIMLKATTIPWGTYQYTDANLGVSVARSIYQTFGVPFSTPQIWNGSVAYCVNTSSGVQELEDAVSLYMSNDQLHLVLASGVLLGDEGATLELWDMIGKNVAYQRISSARVSLPVGALPAGCYVAILRRGNDAVVTRQLFID